MSQNICGVAYKKVQKNTKRRGAAGILGFDDFSIISLTGHRRDKVNHVNQISAYISFESGGDNQFWKRQGGPGREKQFFCGMLPLHTQEQQRYDKDFSVSWEGGALLLPPYNHFSVIILRRALQI
jgi:hypothetical protein